MWSKYHLIQEIFLGPRFQFATTVNTSDEGYEAKTICLLPRLHCCQSGKLLKC